MSLMLKPDRYRLFACLICALFTFSTVCSIFPTVLSSVSESGSDQRNGSDVSENTSAAVAVCPSGVTCALLGGECITCLFNKSCIYGHVIEVNCSVKPDIHCQGNDHFERSSHCRYCYQLDPDLYTCDTNTICRVVSAARSTYIARCRVKSSVICMGNREFNKNLPCNWTGGYKWSTALMLSITLGGFGADRFYLGLWKEGIGKLFSFGGLGVWTLVDVVLIAIRYIGPSDGSLYL